jgi:ribonuclease P protein 1
VPKISEFDREKKLKILELEIDVLRQEGRKAPDPAGMKPQNWEHLLNLETRCLSSFFSRSFSVILISNDPYRSARRKYYQYLWSIEKKQENRQRKLEVKKVEIQERRAELKKQIDECDHLIYGLNNNTMFLRVYDTTIVHWHNQKLIRAMQFGQKIVLDCSYDQHMNAREQQNAAKQMQLCFAGESLFSLTNKTFLSKLPKFYFQICQIL